MYSRVNRKGVGDDDPTIVEPVVAKKSHKGTQIKRTFFRNGAIEGRTFATVACQPRSRKRTDPVGECGRAFESY